MRNKNEITEYMDEAFDRVWLIRTLDILAGIADGKTKEPKPDILKGCLESMDKVCKKYNIDFNKPVYEWDYGYWSGILAALRWVMGEEKDFLDT